MKKISLMLMAFGLVAASCTKSEFDNVYGEDPHADFAQQFTQTFGKVDPNQDWGFASSTMRGTNMNANMWADDWDCVDNVYPDLTADDLAEIKRLLSPGVETHNTIVLPFENYWVQQVYKGEDKYNYHDRCNNADCDHVLSQTELGSDKMNKLGAYNPGQWLEGNEGYEHINNFNSGNNTNTPSADKCGTTHVGTTLMVNMPTTGFDAEHQFAFHNSNDSKVYNNYYIIEYNGYWYVGFDFESHKSDQTHNHNEAMDIERDWCFTDWIVRITPAYAKGTTPEDDTFKFGANARRIIAEDLADNNGSDFDYNDVVFDAEVRNEGGQYVAYIQLLAAGGTIRLTVGGKEVHEAFGVPTTTMVNTEANGGVDNKTAELYTYTIANPTTTDLVALLKEIPIVAYPTGKEPYELTAVRGTAAEKIAVETDYVWTTERQPVQEKYEKFVDYVRHPVNDEKWWR